MFLPPSRHAPPCFGPTLSGAAENEPPNDPIWTPTWCSIWLGRAVAHHPARVMAPPPG